MAERQNVQFQSYLNDLNFCQLIESEQVPSENNDFLMIDAYRLSVSGITLALISKAQNNDNNSNFHDEIYPWWKKHFDEHSSSSLDLFCKNYLYECKEQGLFDVFVQAFK